MRKVIYISSPYSKGDICENVRNQMQIADLLIDAGYAPIIPLLFHYQHLSYPQSYETWLDVDLAQVRKCDAVIRLEGESSGADAEVGEAMRNDIPVIVCEFDDIAFAVGLLDELFGCDSINKISWNN